MSDEATLLPRFCERTGNPCGTDTIHNDEPGCACRQCMLWCSEELKRRWVAMDDQRTENEKLRIALSDCANHAAGFRCTSGKCSTEFLLHVPEEVRLQISARERDRDANKAAVVRVEAERDALRSEFSEAVQDIPVCGGETFGAAVRRIVADRDRFAEICHSVFQVITEGECSEGFSADDLPTAARTLVAERDRGYEFLRRWQEFAAEAMRSLEEVDENTLPDDTATRDVLLEIVEQISRARAGREMNAMTTDRWAQLKTWTWFEDVRREVQSELDRARAAEVALRQCRALDERTIEGQRESIAQLRTELDDLKRHKPACGNRFEAHVCIKREGHSDRHGDGDGGEWS